MLFLKSAVFLRKKNPRQGCTKPKTELGMHLNPHFHQNPLKINKNQIINLPSGKWLGNSYVLNDW